MLLNIILIYSEKLLIGEYYGRTSLETARAIVVYGLARSYGFR